MLPKKVSWQRSNVPLNEWGGGYVGVESTGSIPESVFREAVIKNDRHSVEILALGKQAGSIFEPTHFMYRGLAV